MASNQRINVGSNLPAFGNPVDFVSKVLKSQFGNSEEFSAFERHFYYQTQELNALKNICDDLGGQVSKLQEEKRSLELQLMTEKSLRDQDTKNAAMEMEKLTVQQNAQIYSMKCEVESWKRKCEAMNIETSWLKEQMKTVETEKNQALQKYSELKFNLADFERYRQSFDPYSRKLKESIQTANKRLDELEKAKCSFQQLCESNQKQLSMMTSQLSNWNEEKKKYHRKITDLQQDLMKAKAELVQNSSKLTRAEMVETKTFELINRLLQENKDLQKGLYILSEALGDKVSEADQQLLEKAEQLHNEIEGAVKRLHLRTADFTPPENPD